MRWIGCCIVLLLAAPGAVAADEALRPSDVTLGRDLEACRAAAEPGACRRLAFRRFDESVRRELAGPDAASGAAADAVARCVVGGQKLEDCRYWVRVVSALQRHAAELTVDFGGLQATDPVLTPVEPPEGSPARGVRRDATAGGGAGKKDDGMAICLSASGSWVDCAYWRTVRADDR